MKTRPSLRIAGGIFLLLSLFTFSAWADMRSTDENAWIADKVVKKPDPWMWISGENTHTNETWYSYNWNVNTFQLLGRPADTCNGCTRDGKDVFVDKTKLRLYVNDKEFILKTVCYNPVPIGENLMNRNTGYGGGGFCSAKLDPFGDYKSACYDSDYWDGSIDKNRQPPGPSGGWFNKLWARDFPIIKEMGANSIRIYNSNPTTRAYTQKVMNGQLVNPDIKAATGKYHVPFLDAAENAGLMVIFPLLGDENLLITLPEDKYKQMLRNQLDEVGSHPAIVMFTLGNELGLGSKPQLLEKVNLYIDYARNYLKNTYDRSIPFTHALVDNPPDYDFLATNLDVDVMSTNAGYRGLDFSDLWDGNSQFQGWRTLSQQTGKPVFISEIGWHQINGQQTAQLPGWFNQIWKDLIAHVPDGAIGGAFFEYSDEPLKDDTSQQTMGIVKFQVNVVSGDGDDDGGDGGDGGDPTGDGTSDSCSLALDEFYLI